MGRKMEIELPKNAIATLIKSELPILPRMPFYISGFSPDSSAYHAGLRTNDRIIALNNSPTNSSTSLNPI